MGRKSIFFVLGFLAICPNYSFGCDLQVLSKTLTGAPTHFQIKCEPDTGFQVAWRIGYEENFGEYSEQKSLYHTFESPGYHLVYARVLYSNGRSKILSKQIELAFSTSEKRTPTTSTIIFDSISGKIWNVNRDNNSVAVINANTKSKVMEIPVCKRPRTLALDDSRRIWIVCQDEGAIDILDANTGEKLDQIKLQHFSRPYGIVHSQSDFDQNNWSYVSLEASGKIIRINRNDLSVQGEVDLSRDRSDTPPIRAMALSLDQGKLYVVRHISSQNQAEVYVINTAAFQVDNIIPLGFTEGVDGENSSRGLPNYLEQIVLTPDGKRAWIPAAKNNLQRGLFREGTIPDFETTVRTEVLQLDLEKETDIPENRIDIDNANLMSGIVFASDGRQAFGCAQGSNSLYSLDLLNNDEKLIWGPINQTRRLGPIGMVLTNGDSLLWVHYFASREVGVYNVYNAKQVDTISEIGLIQTVTNELLPPQVLKGKQIFYNSADERMSTDKYLSCASCHLEGGGDSRVWDFTSRGEGLRKTIPLRGRGGMEHGALHWSANFDEVQDFEHDIRGPQGGTGFLSDQEFNTQNRDTPLGGAKAGIDEDLDALAAYVSSLTDFHPSPFRDSDGRMTPEALQGKSIFFDEKTQCSECHVPPRYTSSSLSHQLFDVGTLTKASGFRLLGAEVDSCSKLEEKQKCMESLPSISGLDVPTLNGIWESPPYLHDGSASTLMDVITTKNPNDKHGKTSHLNEQQKKQLVAFLQQLDGLDENGVPIETGAFIRETVKNKHHIKNHTQTFSSGIWKAPSGEEIKVDGLGRIKLFPGGERK